MRLPLTMKFSLVLFLCLFSVHLLAQNQTNAEGRRDGHWVVKGTDSKKPGYAANAIVEEGDYQNGRKVGVWKTFYPNGELKNEITFEGGRPKGPYTTYYENGQVEEQGSWSTNKNTGSFKRFYENGQVQQDFTFNTSGKRDGPQKYYYDNGQLMIEGNWNGGKESGEVKEYFENGKVKSVRVYNDGKMDESKSTFNETAPEAKTVAVTPAPVKDENNKVKTTVAVSQTKDAPNIGRFDGNGQHTLYNKDRQISQKGEFKNGRMVNGKWFKYNKDGILVKIEIYSNGQYVGDGVIDKSMQ